MYTNTLSLFIITKKEKRITYYMASHHSRKFSIIPTSNADYQL